MLTDQASPNILLFADRFRVLCLNTCTDKKAISTFQSTIQEDDSKLADRVRIQILDITWLEDNNPSFCENYTLIKDLNPILDQENVTKGNMEKIKT